MFASLLCFQYAHGQELSFTSNYDYDTSQIYISVTVNNEKHLFLFDNAVQSSIIFLNSPNDLKRYKIKSKTFIYDAKGNRDTAYIVNASILIPELKIKNKKINILALPYSSSTKQLELNGVTGILGLDIINCHDWLIDFNRTVIKILRKNDSVKKENYYNLPTIKDRHSTYLY